MTRTENVERTVEYLPAMYLTGAMKEAYARGKNLYQADDPCMLITGENGTGKELLAKSIHYTLSPGSRFIPISCVNLPYVHFQEKLESCLSDISRDTAEHQGAPCAATLFFRNIGKLEYSVQQDLVRFLQKTLDVQDAARARLKLIFSLNDHSLEMLGQDEAAAHCEPVVNALHPQLLNILPLRDRRTDIKPLASFFIDRFSKEYGKDIGGIHSATLERLENWQWPGNVSELRDVIENAVLLARLPLLMAEDIRFNVSKKFIALESFLSREDFFTLDEIEKIYIQTVLRRMRNNKSKTSKILGISRNTLQSKLESYNALPSKTKPRKKPVQQPLF